MAQSPGIMDYLQAGLQATSLRQAVIANNLANLNTPGFRRHALAFEDVLAEAVDEGRPVTTEELGARLLTPRTTPLNESGSDVQLDVEVGELVKNSAMYKTYARLLGRLYRQIELAMQTPV